jgi:hypothetical protein
MKSGSLSCIILHGFLQQQSRPSKLELARRFAQETRRALLENSIEFMRFDTPEAFAKVAKFGLCEGPTSFPAEAKFVAAILMVLSWFEGALEQWGQFNGKYGDKAFVEIYETLLIQAVCETATTIPARHLISSCFALQSEIGYFDQWIQRISPNSARPSNDKIRHKIEEQIFKLLGKIKMLFREFINELLNPLTFKEMQKGNSFSNELVNYLDLMSTFLKPVLPAGMFLKIRRSRDCRDNCPD